VLREIAHLFVGTRETLALKKKLPQPEFYDVVMQRSDAGGMAEHRAGLAEGLAGKRVLEVGCGTGLMFPFYAAGTEVVAIDPDAAFLELAKKRAGEVAAKIEAREGSVMELAFDAGSFDAVVCSLVLCSVPSAAKALGEIARVMAKGATFRLIEHVRSPRAVPGALMKLFDPLWVKMNGQGCHMDRDTEREVAAAGFETTEVVGFQLFVPGVPAFPMRRIEARLG
jgi:ubiquinone/menaquinone biosynthesis C-methylase UbiE